MEIFSQSGEGIRQKVGCLRQEPGNNVCADCGKEGRSTSAGNFVRVMHAADIIAIC